MKGNRKVTKLEHKTKKRRVFQAETLVNEKALLLGHGAV